MCHQGEAESGFLSADDQGGKSSAQEVSTNKTYVVSAVFPGEKSIHCSFPVDGVETRFMADTGAEITLLPETHPSVQHRNSCCNARNIQPVTVDGKPIPLLGSLVLTVEVNGS